MDHSSRNEMERARCVSLSDDKLFYSLHPGSGLHPPIAMNYLVSEPIKIPEPDKSHNNLGTIFQAGAACNGDGTEIFYFGKTK